jgi:hypothetical protein
MPIRGGHAHFWQLVHHLPSYGWGSLDGGCFDRGSYARWYQHRCMRWFSSRCTPSTTHGCGRRNASSQPDFAGHKWPRPSHQWPGPACSANGLQPAVISIPLRHFVHLLVDLVKPLSTGHKYLFTVIERTGGRRQFHSPLSPLKTAPAPCFLAGSPVGYQPSSFLTDWLNSHCIVDSPLQPAQHRPFADNGIPTTIKRVGRVAPPLAEGCPTSLGC